MSDETTTEMLAEIEGQVEQPVQVREGRWRTRNGEIRHVTPTPEARKPFNQSRYSWYDAHYNQTWLPSGHYTLGGESQWDLLEYLGPIEPKPDRIVTPDDVAAEALAGVWDKAKAEQQVEELRSEVSHVQRLLGEEKRRFAELETLTSDLRAVNAAQEKGINSAARDKADLQHRLDTVAAEWALQAETIRGLQEQLEIVKSHWAKESLERNQWQNHAQRTETQLVEKVSECRNLRIELDALQQAPQAETVAAAEAVSNQWEVGWYHGKARAVETIADWLEPFRQMIEKADNLVESDRASRLCAEIMQNLPHIMRSLTGLADED